MQFQHSESLHRGSSASMAQGPAGAATVLPSHLISSKERSVAPQGELMLWAGISLLCSLNRQGQCLLLLCMPVPPSALGSLLTVSVSLNE